MPSSMRSSVESRNAPNSVPFPDIREYRPSSVSMIDPTMKATPARTNRSATTRAAAAALRTNPVTEMAFGVGAQPGELMRGQGGEAGDGRPSGGVEPVVIRGHDDHEEDEQRVYRPQRPGNRRARERHRRHRDQ